MTFYERYINGETEDVYKDILALEQEVFSPERFVDIDRVLTETFQRVKYNLEVIYIELKNINYNFKIDPKNNFEKPIHAALADTDLLLVKLDTAVEKFGYVPLSLKYFYKIVGAVNFCWDYKTKEELMWNMADPIQIASLDGVVEEVIDKNWKEHIQQYVDDDEFGCAFLDLAADDLHKDNISGGQSYAIEITKSPSIDSTFMNEPHNTTFINYIRICFQSCGFPGITRLDTGNNYQPFFDRVKPLLKPI